jgi:hypothetical protein
MIVHPDDEGLLLIDQADHARLAGVFAANWGNGRFARPEPYESICVAVARHDDGWIPWDAAPNLDPLTHGPINFPHIAVDQHIALYSRGIQQVVADDAYAGLLVNRHCQWLYELKLSGSRRRPLWSSGTTDDARELLRAALADLRRRHDELLGRLAAGCADATTLDETHLKSNSMLIRFYDALSLYFCTGPLKADEFDDVPIDACGELTSIKLRPIDERSVALDPWPFSGRSLTVSVPARRLPSNTFASDAELHDALRTADEAALSFSLNCVSAR